MGWNRGSPPRRGHGEPRSGRRGGRPGPDCWRPGWARPPSEVASRLWLWSLGQPACGAARSQLGTARRGHLSARSLPPAGARGHLLATPGAFAQHPEGVLHPSARIAGVGSPKHSHCSFGLEETEAEGYKVVVTWSGAVLQAVRLGPPLIRPLC